MKEQRYGFRYAIWIRRCPDNQLVDSIKIDHLASLVHPDPMENATSGAADVTSQGSYRRALHSGFSS
jgi:hypothetical protein